MRPIKSNLQAIEAAGLQQRQPYLYSSGFFFKWRSGPLIATASGFWHAGIPLSKSENLCCNINGSDSEIASCEWDSSSVRSTLFLLLLRPWRNAGAVVQLITCELQISSSVKIRIIHTELVAVSTIWAWRRGLGYRIVSCSSQDKSKSMRLRNMESPVSRTKSYTISCVDYLQTRQGWAHCCLPNWKETFHRSLWQWACRHMLGHHLNAGRRHFAPWRSKTTVPRQWLERGTQNWSRLMELSGSLESTSPRRDRYEVASSLFFGMFHVPTYMLLKTLERW